MDELAASPIGKWIPPAAGVIAAALVSNWVCGAPHPRSLTWTGAFLLASSCVGAIFLACAAVVRIACAIFPRASSLKPRVFAFQMAAAAVWFAPLSFFLERQSALGMVAATVLAVAATVGIYANENPVRAMETPTEIGRFPVRETFRSLYPEPLLQELFPALCLALLAEGAAVAGLTDLPTLAAGLSGMFAVFLVRSLHKKVFDPAASERHESRGFTLVSGAVVLTVIALIPYLRFGGGDSPYYSPGRVPVSGNERTQTRLMDDDGRSEHSGYPGIVLWPKNTEQVKLIAPPASANVLPTLGLHPTAVSIPFDGVFWFFRWPDTHPSRRAHVARGSPDEFNIRSTDSRPLLMEAHQYLGTQIQLSCCRQIQVELRNADHYPGTVSVELILRNTSLAGKPFLSLGTMPVSPNRPWKLYEEHTSGNEVLTFPIAGSTSVHQFDEFTVVFRLTPDRSLLAARIGIERFILVPR